MLPIFCKLKGSHTSYTPTSNYMWPYIVCFCGRSIGDLYDLYKAMRLAKYQEAFADVDIRSTDPALLAIADDVHLDMSDVFDQLGLHTICCRVRMTTQVEFKEIFG